MKPPAAANTPLLLTVTYSDRSGKKYTSRRTVGLPRQALAATDADTADESTYYQSTGVRKAVVLARYVDLLRCALRTLPRSAAAGLAMQNGMRMGRALGLLMQGCRVLQHGPVVHIDRADPAFLRCAAQELAV